VKKVEIITERSKDGLRFSERLRTTKPYLYSKPKVQGFNLISQHPEAKSKRLVNDRSKGLDCTESTIMDFNMKECAISAFR